MKKLWKEPREAGGKKGKGRGQGRPNRKEIKKINKKIVYHNHSLKKARHYPVDTIRPPRLLRRAPRKGSNGGVDTERRSGGQKRKGRLQERRKRGVSPKTRRNKVKHS